MHLPLVMQAHYIKDKKASHQNSNQHFPISCLFPLLGMARAELQESSSSIYLPSLSST